MNKLLRTVKKFRVANPEKELGVDNLVKTLDDATVDNEGEQSLVEPKKLTVTNQRKQLKVTKPRIQFKVANLRKQLTGVKLGKLKSGKRVPKICNRVNMADEYVYLDSEHLIYEVEKRPLLYDISLPDYNDRAKKIKCWEEICELIFPDWSELTAAERDNRGR